MSMQRVKYVVLVLVLIVGVSLLAMMPAAAQNGGTSGEYPANTITVNGTGSAYGSPDQATIEIGVERVDRNIGQAFIAANETLEAVIAAVMEEGVAREDVRTTGLNVYQDRRGPMPMDSGDMNNDVTYVVSNQIRVVVRDINAVADVINAAVEAGANNVYGLNFGISDQSALESDAREDAVANARDRAEQLAQINGVELGEVLVIEEATNGFSPYGRGMEAMDAGLGGGAVIEPGQLSVSVQVRITYRINR